MSAIITHDFRLDATERFVDSVSTTKYYLGLGKPDAWPLVSSLEVPDALYENDNISRGVWDSLMAVKNIAAGDVFHCSPRHTWASGTTYVAYDDADVALESGSSTGYYVISDNYNVYLCLRTGIDSAGAATASTVNPDTGVGTVTTGVVRTSDDYVWKFMLTIPTATATAFLTTQFIPVPVLTSSTRPVSGDAEFIFLNQWDVEDNAVDGAIHNIVVTNGGTGYTSSPTVTVVGDGTGATASATVVGGVITEIVLETGSAGSYTYNHGTGYNNASVVITDSAGAGAIARVVIAPPGGFGKKAIRDLRSHYVIFNKTFNGDESGAIPSSGSFRQLSLIADPVDADTSAIAVGIVYNACKALTVSSGSFTPGEEITGSSSGAVGIVVEYSGSTLHYVQDRDSGYVPFTTSDTIGTGSYSVSSLVASDLTYDTGSVMFVENRDAVSRGSSQNETIRLVIEF